MTTPNIEPAPGEAFAPPSADAPAGSHSHDLSGSDASERDARSSGHGAQGDPATRALMAPDRVEASAPRPLETAAHESGSSHPQPGTQSGDGSSSLDRARVPLDFSSRPSPAAGRGPLSPCGVPRGYESSLRGVVFAGIGIIITLTAAALWVLFTGGA